MASDSLLLMLELELVLELVLLVLGLLGLLVLLLAQQRVDRLVVELSEPVGKLAGILVDRLVV